MVTEDSLVTQSDLLGNGAPQKKNSFPPKIQKHILNWCLFKYGDGGGGSSLPPTVSMGLGAYFLVVLHPLIEF